MAGAKSRTLLPISLGSNIRHPSKVATRKTHFGMYWKHIENTCKVASVSETDEANALLNHLALASRQVNRNM
jgi:hypothetical protein